MEMNDIRGIYEGLPYLLRSIFIAAPHEASEVFWRRPVDPQHVCDILLRRGGLDALIVALTLVKEAEITQYQNQHLNGINTVRRCLESLQNDQILGGKLLKNLYGYLEFRWEKAKYYWIPGEEDEEDVGE